MSQNQFEIENYKVTLAQNVHGMGTQIGAIISCFAKGSEGRLTIAFVRPGFELPPNRSNKAGDRGTLFTPAADFAWYVDLLRNEKPVYAWISSSNPANNRIETGFEPVGEGEDNTAQQQAEGESVVWL